MYYYIKNTLERTDTPDLSGGSGKFVAVLTSAQWLESRDRFDMGIEMDMDLSAIDSTKAEVNYDSLTGTFSVPDRGISVRPTSISRLRLTKRALFLLMTAALSAALSAAS